MTHLRGWPAIESSALLAAASIPDVTLLSLDERVRTAGRALGLGVVSA